MRKIYSFLATLVLTLVAAQAQTVTVYTLKTAFSLSEDSLSTVDAVTQTATDSKPIFIYMRGDGAITDGGTDNRRRAFFQTPGTSGSNLTFKKNDTAGLDWTPEVGEDVTDLLFWLEDTGDGDNTYYIKDANGLYLSAITSTPSATASSPTAVTMTDAQESAAKFTISTGSNTDPFLIGSTYDSKSYYLNIQIGGWSGSYVNWWTGTGALSGVNVYVPELTETQITKHTVTWKVRETEDGDDLYTSTATVAEGETATFDQTWPFTTLTNTSVTVGTSDQEAIVLATFNTPFEASSSYEDATWYYVKNVQTNNYMYYDESATKTPFGSSPGISATQYQWAFIGNPIQGYQVINNLAGASLYMYYDTPSAAGQLPYMQSTEQAPAWTLYEGTTVYSEATSEQFSFGYNSWYWNWNNSQSALSFWNGNGSGNAFTVEEATYRSLVAKNITPYYEGEGYFYLNEAGKTALVDAGYEAALTSCDQTTYESLKAIVDNDAYIIYPATGYYRIKSYGTRSWGTSYIGLGANGSNKGTKATGWGLNTVPEANVKDSASTVLKLTVVDADAHTYTIATQGEWATGATTTDAPILMTATESEAGAFTFETINGMPGYCSIKQPNPANGYQYFHEAGNGWSNKPCVCVWESGESAQPSIWSVVDVTDGDEVYTPTLHAAGGSYYATLNLAYGATVDGATAYYGKLNAEGNALDMTEISEIPANTPVVLVGDAETATVKLKSSASAEVTDNALTGNYFAIDWTSSNLTLGSVDDVPGFYTWSDGSTLEANKAYYVPAAASVRGLAFHFGDETTSISTVATPNATSGKVYDLQGRRVLNAQKGLYIVGGKKVLVK